MVVVDPRSSLAIAWRVWKALFFRETVTRLSAGRGAWIWIILEPVAHVVLLMAAFGFFLKRSVGSINGEMFIMTGLIGFFLARNTAFRCMDAIRSNVALFAYRQVLPVDAVLVRSVVEGFLSLTSGIVVILGASILGYAVVPHNLLLVLLSVLGLWLFGMGFGLILSISSELIPEIARIASMTITPLYFLSGVMYSAVLIPHEYRQWLFINPLLHGLELLRSGFFRQYHPASEANLAYLFLWAIASIFFGLALQVRYSHRMAVQ